MLLLLDTENDSRNAPKAECLLLVQQAEHLGQGQKAGFIGHGLGLQLNEQPVFAPRITMQLQEGMVFALEPKIVLPGIGPVGIENSWIVNSDSIEKITLCPDGIKDLTLL